MTTMHTVKYPFDPEHSDVLAICCSDGRYIRALEEFLLGQGIDGHDLMALPGGPAALCRDTASYTELSVQIDAAEFLIRSHHTQRVVLIAHADCGYYKRRHGQADPERQKEDLRRVARALADRYLTVNTALYFARPNVDAHGRPRGGFVLEEVAPTSGGTR